MALFHFHVRHEQGLVHDDDPLDLPDLSDVFSEAIRSAREFFAEATAIGPLEFEIADAGGSVVLKLPMHALAAAADMLERSGAQSAAGAVH